jgi:HSP20 family molecular chaperone IbpA
MTALLKNQEDQTLVNDTITQTRPVFTPRADVVEKEDAFVVQVELPGVTQEGLEITLEQNVLNIQGKVTPTSEDGYKQIYREYLDRDYQRRFVLSDRIDQNGLEAGLENGVLKLKLPKKAEAAMRKIPVRVA